MDRLADFDTIMIHIFEYEGGYVDHPRDPGGATNMGITFRTLEGWLGYPITKQDVKDLSKSTAKEIYRARYWNAVEADTMPPGLNMVLMDAAVNSGPSASIRWVQRALGVTADGILGPVTRKAISEADTKTLVIASLNERRKSVRQFRNYDVFGRGWENRINNVEHRALELVKNG